MGGHVAEKLVIGKENITSGSSNDLEVATNYASQAVRNFGMFGDEVAFTSKSKDDSSQDRNAKIDI